MHLKVNNFFQTAEKLSSTEKWAWQSKGIFAFS